MPDTRVTKNYLDKLNDIKERITCPVLFDYFQQPVLNAKSGFTYESDAISRVNQDPLTREDISSRINPVFNKVVSELIVIFNRQEKLKEDDNKVYENCISVIKKIHNESYVQFQEKIQDPRKHDSFCEGYPLIFKDRQYLALFGHVTYDARYKCNKLPAIESPFNTLPTSNPPVFTMPLSLNPPKEVKPLSYLKESEMNIDKPIHLPEERMNLTVIDNKHTSSEDNDYIVAFAEDVDTELYTSLTQEAQMPNSLTSDRTRMCLSKNIDNKISIEVFNKIVNSYTSTSLLSKFSWLGISDLRSEEIKCLKSLQADLQKNSESCPGKDRAIDKSIITSKLTQLNNMSSFFRNEKRYKARLDLFSNPPPSSEELTYSTDKILYDLSKAFQNKSI